MHQFPPDVRHYRIIGGKSMKNTDVDLINRILNGDETAFTELIQKYQKPVHALVWRKIGDFHIAEEITQDTFLKAYQRLATLKKPQRFASWLYVIATNNSNTWLRKKRLWTQSLEDIRNAQSGKATYSQYVVEEKERTAVEAQREVVKKLLAKLPESERTIITLHYFSEMSSSEIGAFLGVSANTIRSRLRRAQQRLQKEETMIREALDHFKISPNLTEDIMKEVTRLKPAAPSASKPLIPWVIGAASTVLIVLMLGIGSRYLARFQKPYNLDAQSEAVVELIDSPIVQDIQAKSNVRNQFGEESDDLGRGNGAGQESNQIFSDNGNHRQLGLPKEAKTRFGKGDATEIQYSPDGTRFAVGSTIGIWLYDAETGQEIDLLTGHRGLVLCVSFSPDGKTLASGSRDNTVRLWDTNTGQHKKTLTGHTGWVYSVSFSPDGKTLASGSVDQRVHLWDTATGTHKQTLKGHTGYISSASFSPDGKTLASGSRDSTICLWDTNTGRLKKKITGHKVGMIKKVLGKIGLLTVPYNTYVLCVAFSPDGKTLASGSRDTTIRLWDANTGEPKQILREHRGFMNNISFNSDGSTLMSGDWDKIVLWDAATGQPKRTLPEGASSISLSPDGKTLASDSPGRYRIFLWNVTTGEKKRTITGYMSIVNGVAFSPDGKTLAGQSVTGGILLWDINTGEKKQLFRGSATISSDYPGCLSFSPDEKTLANGNGEEIDLWDATTGEHKITLTCNDSVSSISFSLDGSLLASGSLNGTVHLWDAITGEQIRKLTHQSLINNQPISGVSFSPDGRTLASGSIDGRIYLWDVIKGELRQKIEQNLTRVKANWYPLRIHSVSFSSDGKLLASGGPDNTIRVWNVVTGVQKQTLIGHAYKVYCVAFSPNSTTLVSGHTDGTIHLWDANTGQYKRMLSGHTDIVTDLVFSPDGKTLASGSQDCSVLLWDMTQIMK